MTIVRRIVPITLWLAALLLAAFVLLNVFTAGPTVADRRLYFAICMAASLIPVISAFAGRRFRGG